MARAVAALVALLLALAACDAPVVKDEPARVLVFSRTTGFRHDSIPAGVAALRDLVPLDAVEDPTVFTPAGLRRYAAVVFLNTTGDVLNGDQQRAFEGYIRGGGGFVGVHAAADTEYDWPFYGELVGAYFARHPAVQRATVRRPDGSSWSHVDEWYDFRARPAGVTVVLTVDESTYDGGGMGSDHPIAWRHEYAGGRAYYIGLGHTSESYSVPEFRALLRDGLAYSMGP